MKSLGISAYFQCKFKTNYFCEKFRKIIMYLLDGQRNFIIFATVIAQLSFIHTYINTCKFRNSPMCIIGQCTVVTFTKCKTFSTKQHEFKTSSSKCLASYRSSIKSINFKVLKCVKLDRSRFKAASS